MGSLRARRPVSGIRELFRHNLENIVRRQAAGERVNTGPRVNQGLGANQGAAASGSQGLGANAGVGSNQGVAARVIQELGANQRANAGLTGGLRNGVQARGPPQERWVDEASAYNLELQELLTRWGLHHSTFSRACH